MTGILLLEGGQPQVNLKYTVTWIIKGCITLCTAQNILFGRTIIHHPLRIGISCQLNLIIMMTLTFFQKWN